MTTYRVTTCDGPPGGYECPQTAEVILDEYPTLDAPSLLDKLGWSAARGKDMCPICSYRYRERLKES